MATIDRRGADLSQTDPAVATDPNPGLAIKAPVRVATTANITLSGLQAIDGIVVAAADRVLVKNQTDATTNGIYDASTGNWARSVDANNNSLLTQGTQVVVTSGTLNAGTTFELTSVNPIILGTSALNWAVVATALVGPGLSVFGVAGASSGALASIAASAGSGAILAESGSTLAFRTTLSGSYTFTNAQPLLLTASSAGIEIGNLAAVNTPFIDFHSSGNNIDFDARLFVSGGTGTVGAGMLTLDGSLTIAPVTASLQAGLTVNQTYSGTQSGFFGNSVNVSSDNVNAGGLPANGALLIGHDYGGSALRGGRQTLAVQSVFTGNGSVSNTLPQFVSGSFLAQAQGNAGGTGVDTLAHTVGAMYSINPITVLTGSATFFSEAGCEFDLEMQAGSSAWYANVLSLITTANHKVQGAYYDTLLALSAQTGSVGSNYGILFGPMNSAHPVKSTGTLIGATNLDRSGTGTVAATVDKGVDFSLYTCTTAFLLGPSGYKVDGSANTTGGTYNKVTITAPASAATLTIANNKTLTANSSLTLAGTDGKTLTVSNSGTLAGGDAFTLAIAASKTLTVSNTLTFTGTDSTSFAFPSASDTVGCLGTAQTWSKQNIFNIATTIASATAATLDDIKVSAATTTITGNTGSPITALNKVSLGQPTITDSSAVTVTDAATLYIDNAPTAGGSVTLTNKWALRIGTGDAKFGGRILPGAGTFVASTGAIYTSVGVGGNGLVFVAQDSGGTGTFDWGVFNIGGTNLLANPHNTVDIQVGGTAGKVQFPSISTTASAANAFLDNAASNNLLRSTSSRRYKKDIADLGDEATSVLKLRPIRYRSTAAADDPEREHFGFIAEEVAAIDRRLVHWSYTDADYDVNEIEAPDGLRTLQHKLKPGAALAPESVQYERLTVLLAAIAKQHDGRLALLEATHAH